MRGGGGRLLLFEVVGACRCLWEAALITVCERGCLLLFVTGGARARL